MADSTTAQRLARLEAKLESLGTHSDMARLEERITALSEIVTKYVELKNFHNDVLEKRIATAELNIAGNNVKLAIIAVVASASLTGVIAMIIRLFETSLH